TIPEDFNQRLQAMDPFQAWFQQPTPLSPQPSWEMESPKSTANGSNLMLQEEPTGQVVLMLGQATLPHGHQDDLALRLLTCHLGSGMSSLLFRRLREEHGVAYDVGVHHPAREGAAPFVLHASTSIEKAELTLELLNESWWELSQTRISEEDVSLARAKFHGQLAHATQTTGQRAERRAQLRGLGLPDNHDRQSLKAIETLNGEALQAVAKRHLVDPKLSLCGPENSLRNLAKTWQQLNPKHS
ncbi:MAG: insulinase family protein, partial [Prochlorococcus sp.]|nr:insulinase family protein [Prochlorococcus sp.]